MEILANILKKLIGHTEESLSRVVMDRRTKEWVDALPTDRMDAFEISGLAWEKRVAKPWKSFPKDGTQTLISALQTYTLIPDFAGR